MGAPGFWDDQEHAATVSAEHARASRKLTEFQGLESDVLDLEPLAELAEDDAEMAAELEEQLRSVQDRLDALEEARLFSGKYDAGDALVTVNAGAGGTDAQDWAEMVLRMEMRWAEKRGFDVELLEASAGEEAGIKSATFRVRGENAYGLYGSEKGVHRWCGSPRSTPPTGVRRASRDSRSRRSSRSPATSKSKTTTCRSTPTGPAAPAAST
jgi:peptide chain release factor 2